MSKLFNTETKIGVSSNTLKFVMVLFMVLDHCYYYLDNMPIWFTYLGRIVAPIFFFFITEGFFKTKNRSYYIFRMYSFSLITAFGNFLFNNAFNMYQKITNNMFLSLAVSLTIMYMLEYIKQNPKYKTYIIYIPLVIFISTFMIYTEASILGLMMTFVFYYFYSKRILMILLYLIFSLIFTIGLLFEPISLETLFYKDPQWMMIFAVIPILFYNGNKGSRELIVKYGFYIFYPIHIWIIYLFKYLVR